MKHIKLFEEYSTEKIDTRLVSGVKAKDVVDYFDRNGDVYGVGAQFIDFDTVELMVYDTDNMIQDDIDEKLDGAEDVIFSAHLKI